MIIDTVTDNDDYESWVVVTDTGTMTVPKNMANRHARLVQEWVEYGGVVQMYVPPVVEQTDPVDDLPPVFQAYLRAEAKRRGTPVGDLKNEIRAEM